MEIDPGEGKAPDLSIILEVLNKLREEIAELRSELNQETQEVVWRNACKRKSTYVSEKFNMEDFTEKLKKYYRKQESMPKLIDIDDERLKQSWDKYYVRLKLTIKSKDDEDEDGGNMKQIDVEEVFDEFGEKSASKILLLGAGGSGKSTLFQYICYAWANGKLWADRFDCVYRVRLAKLSNEYYRAKCAKNYDTCVGRLVYYNLKDYLKPLDKDEIIESLNTMKTLLLIDGYNEIESIDCESNKEISRIMQNILSCDNVIISSRYNAMKAKYNKSFDRIVESKGLEYKQIYYFIDTYFGNDEKGRNLKNFLDHNDRVRGLCELPINMMLMCLIWSDKKTNEHITKTNKFNVGFLYEEVIGWLGKRYFNKIKSDGRSGDEIITNVFQSPKIKFLQILAYGSFMENGNNNIENKIVQKTLKLVETKINLTEVYNIGLLKTLRYEPKELEDGEFEFIHPTIQEFLAANNAKKLIESEDKEIFSILATHRKKIQYLPLLKFMASIISNVEDEHEKSTNLIKKFWDTILCNVDRRLEFGNDMEIVIIMHLLEQSKVPKEINDKTVYSLDERIPNLDEMQKLVDDTINSDFTIWKNVIIESGYISEKIADRLFDALNNNGDNSNARAALEIMGRLSVNVNLGGRNRVCNKFIEILRPDDWNWNKLCLDTVLQIYDPTIDLIKPELIIKYVWDDNLRPFVLELIKKVTTFQPKLSLSIIQELKSQLRPENCKHLAVYSVTICVIDTLCDYQILTEVLQEVFTMMRPESETNIYAYNGKLNFKEMLVLTNSLLDKEKMKKYNENIIEKFMNFITSAEEVYIKLYMTDVENYRILFEYLSDRSHAILSDSIELFKDIKNSDNLLKGQKYLQLYLQINKNEIDSEMITEIFQSFRQIPRDLWIEHNFHEVSHSLLQIIPSGTSMQIPIRVDLCDMFGLNPKNVGFFINFIKDRPKIALCDFIKILRSIRCAGFNYHNIKMIVLNFVRLERARNPDLFQLLKKSYYEIKDIVLMRSIIHVIGELFDEGLYKDFMTDVIQSDNDLLKSEAIMYSYLPFEESLYTLDLGNEKRIRSIKILFKTALEKSEFEEKTFLKYTESDLFTRNVYFYCALEASYNTFNDDEKNEYIKQSLDIIASSLKNDDVKIVAISLDHFSRILDVLNDCELPSSIIEAIIKAAENLYDLIESNPRCESNDFKQALNFLEKIFKVLKNIHKYNELFVIILNQIVNMGNKLLKSIQTILKDERKTLKLSAEYFLNFLTSINKNQFSYELFENLFDRIMETNNDILNDARHDCNSNMDMIERSLRIFELLLSIIEKSSMRFKLVDNFNKSIVSKDKTINVYADYKDYIYNGVELSEDDFRKISPEMLDKYVQGASKIANEILKRILKSLKSEIIHYFQLTDNLMTVLTCINSSYLSYKIYEKVFDNILLITYQLLYSVANFQRGENMNINAFLEIFFLNINLIYDLYVSSKIFDNKFFKIIDSVKRISYFGDKLSPERLRTVLFSKFQLRFYDCFDITSIYTTSQISTNILTSISEMNFHVDIRKSCKNINEIDVDAVIALIKFFDKYTLYFPACTVDTMHLLRGRNDSPSEIDRWEKFLRYVLFFWDEFLIAIREARKFSIGGDFGLKQFLRILRNQNNAFNSESIILEEIFKPLIVIMMKTIDMFENALKPESDITESTIKYYYNIFSDLEKHTPEYLELDRFLNHLEPIITKISESVYDVLKIVFEHFFGDVSESLVLKKIINFFIVLINSLQRHLFENMNLDYKILIQKRFISYSTVFVSKLKLEESSDEMLLKVLYFIEPNLASNFLGIGIAINIFTTIIVVYNELNMRSNHFKESTDHLLKMAKEILDVIENSLETDCERAISTLIYFVNSLSNIKDSSSKSETLNQFIDRLSKIVDKSVDIIENSLKSDLNNFEMIINNISRFIEMINSSHCVFKTFEESFIRLLSMMNGMLDNLSVNSIVNYLINILKSLKRSSQSFVDKYSQILGHTLRNCLESIKRASKSHDKSLDKFILLLFEQFSNVCITHTIFEQHLEPFTNVMKYILDVNIKISNSDDKIDWILCFLRCVDDSNLNLKAIDNFSKSLKDLLIEVIQEIEDGVNSKHENIHHLTNSIIRIVTTIDKFNSKENIIGSLQDIRSFVLMITNKLIDTCDVECSTEYFFKILKMVKSFQFTNFERIFQTNNSTFKIIHSRLPDRVEIFKNYGISELAKNDNLDLTTLNSFYYHLRKTQNDWRIRISGENFYDELSLYVSRRSTLSKESILVPLFYFKTFITSIERTNIKSVHISKAIFKVVDEILHFAIELTQPYGLGFKISLWYFQEIFKIMKASQKSTEIFKLSFECICQAWIGILKLFKGSLMSDSENNCGPSSIEYYMEIYELIFTSNMSKDVFERSFKQLLKITLKLINLIGRSKKISIEKKMTYFVGSLSICKKIVNSSRILGMIFSPNNIYNNGISEIFKEFSIQNKTSQCIEFKIQYFSIMSKVYIIFPSELTKIFDLNNITKIGVETLDLFKKILENNNMSIYEQIDNIITLFRFISRACMSSKFLNKFRNRIFEFMQLITENCGSLHCNMLLNFVEFFDHVADLSTDKNSPIMECCLTFIRDYIETFNMAHYLLHSRFNELFTILKHDGNKMLYDFLLKTLKIVLESTEIKIQEKIIGLYRLILLKLRRFPEMLAYDEVTFPHFYKPETIEHANDLEKIIKLLLDSQTENLQTNEGISNMLKIFNKTTASDIERQYENLSTLHVENYLNLLKENDQSRDGEFTCKLVKRTLDTIQQFPKSVSSVDGFQIVLNSISDLERWPEVKFFEFIKNNSMEILIELTKHKSPSIRKNCCKYLIKRLNNQTTFNPDDIISVFNILNESPDKSNTLLLNAAKDYFNRSLNSIREDDVEGLLDIETLSKCPRSFSRDLFYVVLQRIERQDITEEVILTCIQLGLAIVIEYKIDTQKANHPYYVITFEGLEIGSEWSEEFVMKALNIKNGLIESYLNYKPRFKRQSSTFPVAAVDCLSYSVLRDEQTYSDKWILSVISQKDIANRFLLLERRDPFGYCIAIHFYEKNLPNSEEFIYHPEKGASELNDKIVRNTHPQEGWKSKYECLTEKLSLEDGNNLIILLKNSSSWKCVENKCSELESKNYILEKCDITQRIAKLRGSLWLQDQVDNLDQKKLNSSEIQLHAMKVPDYIRNNKNLNSYYGGIYGKLRSSLESAIILSEDEVSEDNSDMCIKVLKIGFNFVLSPLGNVMEYIYDFKNKSSSVEKTANFVRIEINPDERLNILVKLSIEATRKREEFINSSDKHENQLKKLKSKNPLVLIQRYFVGEFTEEIYRDRIARMGCIDAMKIIHVIKKGKIENGKNVEDFINEISDVPSNYDVKCNLFKPYVYEDRRKFSIKDYTICDKSEILFE